jgi:hypothetical protein
MAYEATLVTRTHHPINMVVSNTTGIEKGTVLKITDLNTAIATSAPNDQFAGIAAAEKIANDGVTNLAVYRGGRFKMYLSGACTVGDPLITDYNNYVKSAVASTGATLSGSRIIGTALETGATGNTILVELNPMSLGV